MKRIRCISAIVAIAILASAIVPERVHSAPAAPEGVSAPAVRSILPEFSGEYGGAFRDLNIVQIASGPVAIVIQRNEIVLYEASDKWAEGRNDFHPLPIELCRSHFQTKYVNDLYARARGDGVIAEMYVLYQTSSSFSRIERMEYNPQYGTCKSFQSYYEKGFAMTVGGNYVYLLDTAELVQLDRTTLDVVKRYSDFTHDTMFVLDYDQGRVYIGGSGGRVDILDGSSLAKVGEIQVEGAQTISQLDAKGDCVMVRHTPFQNTGPDDHDFSVFQLKDDKYEMVLNVNDHTGLQYSYEPETSGTIAEGHLLMASGWSGLKAWDLKTGRQVLEGNRLHGRYAAEVQRIDKQVYILDYFQGIRLTSWGDTGHGDGGYFDTRPLIPSLSGAEIVRSNSNGRYVFAGGKAGLYVLDTQSGLITDYTTFFTSGEGFPRNSYLTSGEGFLGNDYDAARPTSIEGFSNDDYDMELVGNELWAGDEDSFYRYDISGGRLQKLSSVSWTGGRFAVLDGKAVSITTDFGRPTVASIFDPRTGEVFYTTTVTSQQHGVDVAVSGNRIYVMTERSTDSAIIAYQFDPRSNQMTQAWKMDASNLVRLAVSGKYLWVGQRGPSFSLYEDLGDEAKYIDGDGAREANYTLSFGALGPWGFVSSAWGLEMFRIDRGLLSKLGTYQTHQEGSGSYIEDVSIANDNVILGLGARGVEVTSWQWATNRVFLPLVGWTEDHGCTPNERWDPVLGCVSR